MDEFMTREVNNRRAYGALTWVVTMVKNWKNRQELRKLWHMSDYHLADIGLTRATLARDLKRSLILNWDFERERDARLAWHDDKGQKSDRRSLPLSSREGGQPHLPAAIWLFSEENLPVTADDKYGIPATSAMPMAEAISAYSIAVAPRSSFQNDFIA
jgi:uncharacterized protein YjiS (DUF1127 family)